MRLWFPPIFWPHVRPVALHPVDKICWVLWKNLFPREPQTWGERGRATPKPKEKTPKMTKVPLWSSKLTVHQWGENTESGRAVQLLKYSRHHLYEQEAIQETRSRPRICQSEGPVWEALRIRQTHRRWVTAGTVGAHCSWGRLKKENIYNAVITRNHFEIIPQFYCVLFSNILDSLCCLNLCNLSKTALEWLRAVDSKSNLCFAVPCSFCGNVLPLKWQKKNIICLHQSTPDSLVKCARACAWVRVRLGKIQMDFLINIHDWCHFKMHCSRDSELSTFLCLLTL